MLHMMMIIIIIIIIIIINNNNNNNNIYAGGVLTLHKLSERPCEKYYKKVKADTRKYNLILKKKKNDINKIW